MAAGWWSRVRAAAGGHPIAADLRDVDPPEDPRLRLRRIAAEAVIRQDEAEQVLLAVRAHVPLGQVAPLAGPLIRRFFALRDELPPCRAVDDVRIRATLDVILHHHALVLSTALDLLAYEWRSERIARQVETFQGLGNPARLLEEVYAELSESTPVIKPLSVTER